LGKRAVILLDTHIWVWWVHADARLSDAHQRIIDGHESQGLGVSIMSCWEVAKLVELGRLRLPYVVDDWLARALSYPGIILLELTPEIVVESTRLPGGFHRDPADQLIVATARVHGCPLVTADTRLLDYPHVETRP
jgi:PIN domain nuclease of toxin-antitoxin system